MFQLGKQLKKMIEKEVKEGLNYFMKSFFKLQTQRLFLHPLQMRRTTNYEGSRRCKTKAGGS